MRYLANCLAWRDNPLHDFGWVGSDGDSLPSEFSFGGAHDWQSPIWRERLFATEPLDVRQAQAWIQRESFQSLVVGAEFWPSFLSDMLGVEVQPSTKRKEEQPSMRLGVSDVVLRAGFRGDCFSNCNSSNAELLEKMSKDHSLVGWYLHYLRPYEPGRFVHYDAGL